MGEVNNGIGSVQDAGTPGAKGKLTVGSPGTTDSWAVGTPSIIKTNSSVTKKSFYQMWYTGMRIVDGRGYHLIHYATSTDGLIWTKRNNKVEFAERYSNGINRQWTIFKGGKGSGDYYAIAGAEVIRRLDGKFQIFYYGLETEKGGGKIYSALEYGLK